MHDVIDMEIRAFPSVQHQSTIFTPFALKVPANSGFL
jgi:hypothetical protein